MDPPDIPILLLGDSGIGKTTFLSRLTLGPQNSTQKNLPTLRDLDQPFLFNVTLQRQPLRLNFYDTSSPENYTLLTPSIVILCYSIADPSSLVNLKTKWKILLEQHFGHDETLPVIVLGLQRDARCEEDYDGRVRRFDTSVTGADIDSDSAVLTGRTIVYPQEALRVAAEMRCDRYCECSALTGDLCRETFEDIAKTALATTTEAGGRSKNPHCVLM